MDNGYYERVAIPGLARGVLHRASLFHDRGRRQARIFFSIRERDIQRGEFAAVPLSLSVPAALPTKSEFSSSAITIDIHLLDPDVDRSMAEFKECRLEWSWILIGASGGGSRDSESF